MRPFLTMTPGSYQRHSEVRACAVDCAESPVVRWEMLPAHIWNSHRMMGSNTRRSSLLEPLAGIAAHVDVHGSIPLSPRNNLHAAAVAVAEAAATTAAAVEAAFRADEQSRMDQRREFNVVTPDFPSVESSPVHGGDRINNDNKDSDTSRNIRNQGEADFQSVESGRMDALSPFHDGGEWVLQDASPRSTRRGDATSANCTAVEAELFFETDMTDLGTEMYRSPDGDSDDYTDDACSSGAENGNDGENDVEQAETNQKGNKEIQEDEEAGKEEYRKTKKRKEVEEQQQGAAVGDMWHSVCPVHGLDGIEAPRLRKEFEGGDADEWTDVAGVERTPAGLHGPCSCLEPLWPEQRQDAQQQETQQMHTAAEAEHIIEANSAKLPYGGINSTEQKGGTVEPQLQQPLQGSSTSCSSSSSSSNRNSRRSRYVTTEAAEGYLSPASSQTKADVATAGRLQALISSLEAQQWRRLLRAHPELHKMQVDKTKKTDGSP